MITFKAFVAEMAAPSQEHLAKTYYHGTSSDKAAEGILQHGIQPGDIVMPERHSLSKSNQKRPNLTPVKGRVYITPDLGFAQIYAIGGDYAGSNHVPREKYGYLFVIDGKELKDIQPDEDDIGKLAYYAITDGKHKSELYWLTHLAQHKLTAGQYRKFLDADYIMWAHFGKKVLPLIDDKRRLQLIDLGANIAHEGPLQPTAAYKLELANVPKLKKDGSTFFELAEKLK